jgi:hypothetical protein
MSIPTTEHIVTDLTLSYHPDRIASTILPGVLYNPEGERLLRAYMKHRPVRGVYRVEWNALYPNPMERALGQLITRIGEERLLELTETEMDGLYALEASRVYTYNDNGRISYAGRLNNLLEGVVFGDANRPIGIIPENTFSALVPAELDCDGKAIISTPGRTINYGYLSEVAGIINTATLITFH